MPTSGKPPSSLVMILGLSSSLFQPRASGMGAYRLLGAYSWWTPKSPVGQWSCPIIWELGRGDSFLTHPIQTVNELWGSPGDGKWHSRVHSMWWLWCLKKSQFWLPGTVSIIFEANQWGPVDSSKSVPVLVTSGPLIFKFYKQHQISQVLVCLVLSSSLCSRILA